MTARRCPASRWGMVGLVLAASATMLLPEAAIADDLEIKRARWRSDRNQLDVRGEGRDDRTVTVVNAFDPSQVIGTDRVDDDEWRVRRRGVNPPPCRVRVTQSDGEVAERNVRRAPANCAPKAPVDPVPPPQNQAPVCSITNPGGNLTISEGDSVNFVGNASDPDNDPLTLSWNFPGGNPGSSNQAAQSVTYANAGVFTASFSATDDSGASCPQVTRTITVEEVVVVPPPQNEPPVCTITDPAGNVTINVGGSVNFAATATDPDNDPLTVSWTFPGGTPASANVAAPGAVTYNGAGTFTARFSASDGQASCAATRTVTVNDPQAELIVDPVPEEAFVNGNFRVLATNDLGMHCADLDYQVFSILPPFNVVHAQVIQRAQRPVIVDNTNTEVVYTAASASTDPGLALDPAPALVGTARAGVSINSTGQNDPLAGVFKTNFWDLNPATGNTHGYDTYSPLYFGLLFPTDIDAPDMGLPVFDSALLRACLQPYLDGTATPEETRAACAAAQQANPGIGAPYLANTPQAFDRFDHEINFFNELLGGTGLGGIVTDVNWFAADGIPILPVDDAGRGNAYPLVRVQALNRGNGSVLASTDVVLPVASEADCQGCHVEPVDCATTSAETGLDFICNGQAMIRTAFNIMTLDGDDNGVLPPGDTALEQLLNTAKINILRVHDAKHGTALDENRPVQCATCHYTPALDLAQLGPMDAGNVTQRSHITMSRAMHGHHGALTRVDEQTGADTGELLFPDMPGPVGRTRAEANAVLNETCYQCHPGKRTQCLRGAMEAGGVTCQDCHGQSRHVGNDFSANLPNTPFPEGADLTKRVPWASEPGCQSCHTGDARNTNHPAGAVVADDGIRLLQAFMLEIASDGTEVATPIVAANSRFAEDESLYRLSKGHGGVMCEGCHGSTHAIYPNPNAAANDNVASNQLQGHSGTITECSTCHTSVPNANTTLGGPHGMHVVGNTNFARGDHKDAAENNANACRACHGNNGEGTVLSKMATTRTLECDRETAFCPNGNQAVFPRGHEVTCTDCHDNEL